MADGTDRLLGQPLFGGYVITRKIGTGGMGAVYLVENPELGKKLAIKVLLPDRSTSATATARFLAEARGASAINHRNIITILDAAQLPDGRHYILMEYLEGTTLRRYARGLGPMPLDVTLAILAQVCSGLQAAHDRGIIHRDLKPSNIFVAPQPDNPYFTKILDFGIAKLEDPLLAGEVHTKSQTVAGTPNYMAPEQARALRDVDHRTDIYSVGVLAYELLTGRLPYKAKSVGDLVYQQSSTTPTRARDLRKDLPKAWEELIHSAISLDPSLRPPCAQEVARRMMMATPRGEEIARATASLLFTSLSESTSLASFDDHDDDNDNDNDNDGSGDEDRPGAALSRTVSVPLEGFTPGELRQRRGTGSVLDRSGKTGSTFGLQPSAFREPLPTSNRPRMFAVISAMLVLALAFGLVKYSGATDATAHVPAVPAWDGFKGDAIDAPPAETALAGEPVALPLIEGRPVFGPAAPPPEAPVANPPKAQVAESGRPSKVEIEQKARPLVRDTAVTRPGDPNELFKDRN